MMLKKEREREWDKEREQRYQAQQAEQNKLDSGICFIIIPIQ